MDIDVRGVDTATVQAALGVLSDALAGELARRGDEGGPASPLAAESSPGEIARAIARRVAAEVRGHDARTRDARAGGDA